MTTLSTSPSSNTSPSSTISNPESALPTPDLPYTSRRGSLASPSLELLDVPDGPKTVEDVFTASGMPPTLARPPSVSPPADHRPVPLIIPSVTSPSPLTRRSATLPPSSSTRAPPPPPILVRRPTDLGSTIVEVPIPNGSSSGSPRSRGLNISGLPELSEAADSLAELIPTPRRTAFGNGASVPASPAWQSLEGPWPTPNRPRPSPSPGPPGRGSLDVARPPLSPLGPKRFEPTPMHGLHSRNLSLFFPQPGEAATGVNTPGTPLFRSPEEVQEAVMIEGTTAFSGNGDWKFGKSNGGGSAVLEPPAGAKRSQRRGHHHKHSLSHNFFSFLDPTQTDPSLVTSPIPSPGPSAKPQPVPMPLSIPSLSPLPPPKSDPKRHLLLSLGVLEFLIGAGLWVEGQMSGWRCLAGVGYLVVFDAIGLGVKLVGGEPGEGARSLRRPYGAPRLMALLSFAQSLFLVFAAVYIAKESIEQVILGSAAHEHAVGGSHGHGEAIIDGDERPFPHFLLLCAAVTSICSGGVPGNHSKLVAAVGPLFLPARFIALPIVETFAPLLANPFTLTVAGSSAGILLGSIIVPPSSLHSLDSALSLVLTLLTAALSHPPTLAFAHVLLQTAPSPSAPQMRSLRRVLKDVTLDRRILGLGTMRCWCITPALVQPEPHTPSITHTPSGSVSSSPRTPNFSSPGTSPTQAEFDMRPSTYPSPYGLDKGTEAPMVVTLMVHVHPDVSDRDVLEVTKMVWGKVNGAVKSGGGGEVSVGVKRGWEGLDT